MRLALLSLSAALFTLAHVAPAADARTVWLCQPGKSPNPCAQSLTATVISADGTTRTERTRRAGRPKIDCFYVYPTVSSQTTVNANKRIDAEQRAVARAQASRFSKVCRVWAPIYRQLTLAAITDPANRPPRSALVRAYGDVRAAWLDYLRNHNRGRGVVLIGHSQGTGMLTRLVQEQIDPNRRLRSRLVSALLIGGDVTVRKGRRVGGSFDNVPGCAAPRETGCVVAFSSFNQTPPDDSLFGLVPSVLFPGADPKLHEVLCTNPAALGGGTATLRPYFPTAPFPGPLGLVAGAPPAAPTPWATFPALYSAECRRSANKSWLQVTDIGGAGDPRQRVTQAAGPTWGLHLLDVSLALGNLVALVERQAAAYARR